MWITSSLHPGKDFAGSPHVFAKHSRSHEADEGLRQDGRWFGIARTETSQFFSTSAGFIRQSLMINRIEAYTFVQVFALWYARACKLPCVSQSIHELVNRMS